MDTEAKGYEQLDLVVREEISRGLACGLSPAEIARCTGRHRATIGREIKRGWAEGVGYRAHWAHSRAADAARRKGRQPRLVDGPLRDEVHAEQWHALATLLRMQPASVKTRANPLIKIIDFALAKPK